MLFEINSQEKFSWQRSTQDEKNLKLWENYLKSAFLEFLIKSWNKKTDSELFNKFNLKLGKAINNPFLKHPNYYSRGSRSFIQIEI
jgi:hypothetical protein